MTLRFGVTTLAAFSVAIPLTLDTPQAHAETMVATWYACPFGTDCVASRKYPKGTHLLLRNRKKGAVATAVVRDYGPARWTRRDIDVGVPIAHRLGMIRDGVAILDVKVLGRN